MKDSWDKVFRSLLWELQVPRGRWNAKMRGSLFHIALFFMGKKGGFTAMSDQRRSPISFQTASGANLHPFGAAPSEGRRECAAFSIAKPPSHTSSFRAKARNLFRSRSGEAVRRGERETPHSLRLGSTVFHAESFTKENGNGKRKRSLGCARDDETREGISHILFLTYGGRQPPPLRGTSFQRKEGV